ncbi:MAG: T9SS type A sorting domain-containing protein [Calditrichales bacterium]|nr:MAG: T9SS type A sorting domain-containing protein [Calditrichales bacterium]
MRPISRSVLFFFLFVTAVFSQVEFYNTLTQQVGPGVVHRKYIAPKAPWTLDVVEIDLTNPYISLETLKANNRLAARETPSSMSVRNSSDGHQVVSAVNGDFYDGNSMPIGTQVMNGVILKLPVNRPVIGVGSENDPMAGVVSFSGQVIHPNGINAIHGVNQTRLTDQLVVYNHYYGISTGTNAYGTEVRVRHLTDWVVNDTVRCVVDSIRSGAGDMGISSNGIVLSGHGSSAAYLQNTMQKGDTIAVVMKLKPGLDRIKQLVGGNPTIIRNGQNYAIIVGGSFVTDRHPRTAAGFSQDSSKFYLVTVDGRQTISKGMSLIEMADFMIDLGIWNAINLDGGGSTVMVVRDQIENSPSDGSERPVTNGFAVISSAPKGPLASLQVRPDNERIVIGKSLLFKASGWDENYSPVSIDQNNLTFEVSGSMGSIDNTGLFTAANDVDSGYVIVRNGDLIDSAYVRIKTVTKIAISPKSATTDTNEPIQFVMSAIDEDGLPAPISSISYEWECLHPEIGSVDSTGIFKGKKEGQAAVVARIAGIADTAWVNVEVIEGTAVLDSMIHVGSWSVSGILYDDANTSISVVDTPSTLANGALRLDYQFVRSSVGRSYVYLNTDIQVFGLPDTISLDVKSDGEKHWVSYMITDDNDELFRGSTGQFANSIMYDTLSAAIGDFGVVNPPATFHFPIRFKAIEIRLGYETLVGGTNTGYLYFDNLRVVYPELTSILPLTETQVPKTLTLHQNYPNPFNARTVIAFDLPKAGKVDLTIYDLQGREVTRLLNRMVAAGTHTVHWETGTLASGVYFYRLNVEGFSEIKKMMLVK